MQTHKIAADFSIATIFFQIGKRVLEKNFCEKSEKFPKRRKKKRKPNPIIIIILHAYFQR